MSLSVGEIEATIRLRDEMSARLVQVRQSARGLADDLQNLANTASAAATQVDSAFKRLNHEVAATGKASAAMGQAVDQATDSFAGGSAKAETFADRLHRLSGQAFSMAKDVVGACGQIATAFDRVIELPGQLKAAFLDPITNTISKLGTTLSVGLTVPITAFATSAASAAISFESAFAGVRKTVDGVNDSVGRLTAFGTSLAGTLRKMATDEIPIAVDQLAKIAEIGGQLGVSAGGITQFTRVIAQLADTTDLSLEAAAVGVAQLGGIMGIAHDQFDRLGSTLDRLGSESEATESKILDMATRLAASGKIAGLSTANVLAYATALASVGVEAEAGGTAFSKVFQTIFEAVKTNNEQLDIFAHTAGQSAKDFANAFRSDPAAAIASFVEGLHRTSDAGENVFATLKDVEFQDARLKRSILSLSEASGKLRIAIRKGNEEWRTNTYLAREAGIRWQTTASQLTRLWSRVKDLGIVVGNALNPGIKAAIRLFEVMLVPVAALANAFSKLPGFVQVLVIGFFALAAALGPVVLLLLHLGKAFLVFSTLSSLNTVLNLFSGSLLTTNTALGAVIGRFGPFVGGVLKGLDSTGALTAALVGCSGTVQKFGLYLLGIVKPLFSIGGLLRVLQDSLGGTAQLFGKVGLALANLIGWPKLLAVALITLVATIPQARGAFLELVKILQLIASIALNHVIAAFHVLGKAAALLGERIGGVLEWMKAHLPFMEQIGKAAGAVAGFFTKLAEALGLLNDEGWVSEAIVAALAVAILVLAGRAVIGQLTALLTLLRAVGGGAAGAARALLGFGRATKSVVNDTEAATSAGVRLGGVLAAGIGRLAGYAARFGSVTAAATKSSVGMGVATVAAYTYEAAVRLATVTTEQWAASTGPLLRATKAIAAEYAVVSVAVQRFITAVRGSSSAFSTKVIDTATRALGVLGIRLDRVGAVVRNVSTVFRSATAPVLTYIQLQVALVKTYGLAEVAAIKFGRTAANVASLFGGIGSAVRAVVVPIKNFYQSYVLLENVAAIVGAALGLTVRGFANLGSAAASIGRSILGFGKILTTLGNPITATVALFRLVVTGFGMMARGAATAASGLVKISPAIFSASKAVAVLAATTLRSVAAPVALSVAYQFLAQAIALASMPVLLLQVALEKLVGRLGQSGRQFAVLTTLVRGLRAVTQEASNTVAGLMNRAFVNMSAAVAGAQEAGARFIQTITNLGTAVGSTFGTVGRFLRAAASFGPILGKWATATALVGLSMVSGQKAMVAEVVTMLKLEGAMLRVVMSTGSLAGVAAMYASRSLRMTEAILMTVMAFGRFMSNAIDAKSVGMALVGIVETIAVAFAYAAREVRAWLMIAEGVASLPREIGAAFQFLGKSIMQTTTAQKAAAAGGRVISAAWRGISGQASSAAMAFRLTTAGMNESTAAAFLLTRATGLGLRMTLGFARAAQLGLGVVAVSAKGAAVGISKFYGQLAAAYQAFGERAAAVNVGANYTLRALMEVRSAMLGMATGIGEFALRAASGMKALGKVADGAVYSLKRLAGESFALVRYSEDVAFSQAKAAGGSRTMAVAAETARRASKALAGALGATATEAEVVGKSAGYATRAWLTLVSVAKTLVRSLAAGAAGAVDLVAAALSRVARMAANVGAITGLDVVWRKVAAAAAAANLSFRSLDVTIRATAGAARIVTAARERLLIVERSATAQAAITAQLLKANEVAMRAAGAGASFFGRTLGVIDKAVDSVVGRLGVMRAAVLGSVAGQRVAAAAASAFAEANHILWETLDGIMVRIPALRNLSAGLAVAERAAAATANLLSASRVKLGASFASGIGAINRVRESLTFLSVLERASASTQAGMAAAREKLTAAYAGQQTKARTLGVALGVVTTAEKGVIAVSNLLIATYLKMGDVLHLLNTQGVRFTMAHYAMTNAMRVIGEVQGAWAALPPIFGRAGVAALVAAAKFITFRTAVVALAGPAKLAELTVTGLTRMLRLLEGIAGRVTAKIAFMEQGAEGYAAQVRKAAVVTAIWKTAQAALSPVIAGLNALIRLYSAAQIASVKATEVAGIAMKAAGERSLIMATALKGAARAAELFSAIKAAAPLALLAAKTVAVTTAMYGFRSALGLAEAVIDTYAVAHFGATRSTELLAMGVQRLRDRVEGSVAMIAQAVVGITGFKTATLLLTLPMRVAERFVGVFDRLALSSTRTFRAFNTALSVAVTSQQPFVKNLSVVIDLLQRVGVAVLRTVLGFRVLEAVSARVAQATLFLSEKLSTYMMTLVRDERPADAFISRLYRAAAAMLTFGNTSRVAGLLMRGAAKGLELFEAIRAVGPLGMMAAKIMAIGVAGRLTEAGMGVLEGTIRLFTTSVRRADDALALYDLALLKLRVGSAASIRSFLSAFVAVTKWSMAVTALAAPFVTASLAINIFDTAASKMTARLAAYRVEMFRAVLSNKPFVAGLAHGVNLLLITTNALLSASKGGRTWGAALIEIGRATAVWLAQSAVGLRLMDNFFKGAIRLQAGLRLIETAFRTVAQMGTQGFAAALRGASTAAQLFSAVLKVIPIAMLALKATALSTAVMIMTRTFDLSVRVIRLFNTSMRGIVGGLEEVSLGVEMFRLGFSGAIRMIATGAAAFVRWATSFHVLLVPFAAAHAALTALNKVSRLAIYALNDYKFAMVGASKSTQPFVAGLARLISLATSSANALARSAFAGMGWGKSLRAIITWTKLTAEHGVDLNRMLDRLATVFDRIGQAMGGKIIGAFTALNRGFATAGVRAGQFADRFDAVAQAVGGRLVGAFRTLAGWTANLTRLGAQIVTVFDAVGQSVGAKLVAAFRALGSSTSVLAQIGERIVATFDAVGQAVGTRLVAGFSVLTRNLQAAGAAVAKVFTGGNTVAVINTITAALNGLVAQTRGLMVTLRAGMLPVMATVRAAVLTLSLTLATVSIAAQRLGTSLLVAFARLNVDSLMNVVRSLRAMVVALFASRTAMQAFTATGATGTVTMFKALWSGLLKTEVALKAMTAAFWVAALRGRAAALSLAASGQTLATSATQITAKGWSTTVTQVGAGAAGAAAGAKLAAGAFTTLGASIGGAANVAGIFLAKWVLLPAALGEVVRMMYLTITGSKSLIENWKEWWNTLSLTNNAVTAAAEILGLYERESTKAARAQKEFNDEVSRMVADFSGDTMRDELLKIKRAFDQTLLSGKDLPQSLDAIKKKLVELQAQAKEKGFDLYDLAPWARDLIENGDALRTKLSDRIDDILAEAERLKKGPGGDDTAQASTTRGPIGSFFASLFDSGNAALNKKALTDQAAAVRALIKEAGGANKILIRPEVRSLLFGYDLKTIELVEHAKKIAAAFEELGKKGADADTLRKAAEQLAQKLADIQNGTGGLPEWANKLLRAYPILKSAFDLLSGGGAAAGAKTTEPVGLDPLKWTRLHDAAVAAAGKMSAAMKSEILKGLAMDQGDSENITGFIKELTDKFGVKLDPKQWEVVFATIKDGASDAGKAADRADKFIAKITGVEAQTKLRLMVEAFRDLKLDPSTLTGDQMEEFLSLAAQVRRNFGDLSSVGGAFAEELATKIKKGIGSVTFEELTTKAVAELSVLTARLKGMEFVSPELMKSYTEALDKLESDTGKTVDKIPELVAEGAPALRASFKRLLPGTELAAEFRKRMQTIFEMPSDLTLVTNDALAMNAELMLKLGQNGKFTASQIEEFGQKAVELANRLRGLGGPLQLLVSEMGALWLQSKGVKASIMALPADELSKKLGVALQVAEDSKDAIRELNEEIQDLSTPLGPDTLTSRISSATREYELQRGALERLAAKGGEFAELMGPRMDKLSERFRANIRRIGEEWLRNGELTRKDLRDLAADATARYKAMAASGLFSAESIRKAWEEMIRANIAALGDWAARSAELFDGIAGSLGEGLTAILGQTKSFADAFKDIWLGIKNTLLKIFQDIVTAFIRKMLMKLIEAASGKGGGTGGIAAILAGVAGGAAGGGGGQGGSGIAGIVASAGQWQRQSGPAPSGGIGGDFTMVGTGPGGVMVPVPFSGMGSEKPAPKPGFGVAQGVGTALVAAGAAYSGYQANKNPYGNNTANVAASIGTGAAAGFMVGGPIGLAVGAVAAGIGAIIANQSPLKKVMKGVARDFGVQISEELGKAIEKDSQGAGGRQFGALRHLSEIVGEGGGVEKFGIGKLIAKVNELFDGLAGGKVTMKEAMANFSSMFTEMARVSTDKTGLISKDFKELIARARAFGMEFEELTQWVNEQSEKLVGGIAKMVAGFDAELGKAFKNAFKDLPTDEAQKLFDSLGTADEGKTGPKEAPEKHPGHNERKRGGPTDTLKRLQGLVKDVQPEFDRLGRIALAAFNGMVKAGKSPVEAILAMGDSLDILIATFDKLSGAGLTAGAAFNQLKRFRTLVKDNQALVESIQGINDAMVALANLDALTPEAFTDLVTQAKAAHDKLIKAGFTENEVLSMMVPTLRTIQKLHDEQGFKIDANTQKLLDAAKAQGLLGDEAKTAAELQEETNGVLMEGLGAIIEALGGTLPQSFIEFRKKAEEEAQRVRDALNKIPRDINIGVNFDVEPLPNPDNGPSGPPSGPPRKPTGAATGGIVGMNRILQFARGGQVPEYRAIGGTVGRVLPFVPKGTDTVPAMLTPGEMILNATQQARLAETLSSGHRMGQLVAQLATNSTPRVEPTHTVRSQTTGPAHIRIDHVTVNVPDGTPDPSAFGRKVARGLFAELRRGGGNLDRFKHFAGTKKKRAS